MMVAEGVELVVAVLDVEEGGLEMVVETGGDEDAAECKGKVDEDDGEDDAVEDGETWSVLFKK